MRITSARILPRSRIGSRRRRRRRRPSRRHRLASPAVVSVIGSVLYEGIFEFIQTVDILGNIVNGLPIIGPVRKQIMTGLKRELDRTLGKQVFSRTRALVPLKSFSSNQVQKQSERACRQGLWFFGRYLSDSAA
jgi:hypothetical protein